jgi:fimbrial chaperone protein
MKPGPTLRHRIRGLKLALATAAMGLAPLAQAGSFEVTPMRVDLDQDARTGIVNVINDDDRKLSLQVRLAEWRQTADGKDEYTESRDLIFFPQVFSVDAHSRRIIRIGTRGASPSTEKDYRLYIGQIPEAPPPDAGTGPQVRLLLQFSIPITVAPVHSKREVAMGEPQVEKGKVRVEIRNSGNRSEVFETLALRRGKDTVAEVTGWRVLPGATRVFEIPVDPANCIAAGTLELGTRSEGQALSRSFTASPALCPRP